MQVLRMTGMTGNLVLERQTIFSVIKQNMIRR